MNGSNGRVSPDTVRNGNGRFSRVRRGRAGWLIVVACVVAAFLLVDLSSASQPESVGVGVGGSEPADDGGGSEGDPPEETVGEGGRPGPEPGEKVTVEYVDGRTLIGEFVGSGAESVTIRISNVDVTIARSEIDIMTVLGTPAERYRRMRPAIADDDVGRLLTLARWLQGHRMYRSALEEVKLALASDPTNEKAWVLHRELESQIDLFESRRRRRMNRAEKEKDPDRRERTDLWREEMTRRIEAARDIDVLEEDEINLVKVYELDLNDPPRVRIEREAVERFLDAYADHPVVPETREGRRAFHRKSPVEILDVMFRVRARDFYGEATVIDDPRSMDLFRKRVQATWLVNNCATSRCHGGPDTGGLWLVNRRKRSDASTYTNLLILERTELPDGTSLIDYERPEKSPLLQFALPRDDTARPHPEVRGWRPAFRSRRTRSYRQSVDWIESMYKPRPEYPIEYTPPALREGGTEQKYEPVER